MTRVDVTDVGAQLPQVDPAEPAAQHLDRAAGGVDQGAAQAEQGGLARAVGTKERPVLARPDRQGDLLEDRLPVPDDMHVLGAQDLRHRIARFSADSTAWTAAAGPTPAPQAVVRPLTRHSA
jgi:hypothetical protein